MDQRVQQFQSFYKMENERPLLGFFLGSEYPLARYPSMAKLPDDRLLRPADIPIDGFLSDSEDLHVSHERCGGDFIWSASAYWGIPWLEVALGCPIFASHQTGSIYAEPPVDGPDACVERLDRANPWVTLMGSMLDALAETSKGRWPVGTTRMRGISDLLSALYGGADFVLAMIDDGEPVRACAHRLARFWLDVARFQLEKIPDFFGGIGSFYYNAWAPAGTVWCQEDANALLSPDLYTEFIEGPLHHIATELPGSIMHQHSTGFVPTDSYLHMPFLALELHKDEGGPSMEALFPRHMAILARKPLIIWGNLSPKDLDWVFDRLPPRGLAVITVVNDEAEAGDIWEKYSRRW